MNAPLCNVCHTPLSRGLRSVVDPQTRETFEIAQCPACGLGHTLPQPEDLAPYYGATYHGARHGLAIRHVDRRRRRWISSVAPQASGRSRRILDVGCGDGSFLALMQRSDFEVTGTELAPTLARASGIYVEANIDQVGHRGPFDVITFWHSLEHMKDPLGTIRQAASLLAPGGVVVIAVPNAESLQARIFGRSWIHLDVPRHLFHFTNSALQELLGRAQLHVFRRWALEIENGAFGWVQSALNTVMHEPNALFATLTGRTVTPINAALSVLGAVPMTMLTFPVEVASASTHQAGSLIVAARAS